MRDATTVAETALRRCGVEETA